MMEETRSIDAFLADQDAKLAEIADTLQQHQTLVERYKLDRLQVILDGQLTANQKTQREDEQRQFLQQLETPVLISSAQSTNHLPRRMRGISI
ncbi:hypothetical protein ACQKP8_15005 [Photobacterium alginatilyticum]|uniref:hypothetical protein n=1 Tax=Photobacterium alginatilyticum TaxID=1775171 RepID=UPI0040692694